LINQQKKFPGMNATKEKDTAEITILTGKEIAGHRQRWRQDPVILKGTGETIGFIQLVKPRGGTIQITSHALGCAVLGYNPKWILHQHHEETLGEKKKRGQNIHKGQSYTTLRTCGVPGKPNHFIIEPHQKITVEDVPKETTPILTQGKHFTIQTRILQSLLESLTITAY
jgi:hypothetical protein